MLFAKLMMLDTIRVGLKTGTYKLLVIANAGEMSSFKPEDYYDKTVSLADQVDKPAGQVGEKGFVMTNIARDVEIKKTAGEWWSKPVF